MKIVGSKEKKEGQKSWSQVENYVVWLQKIMKVVEYQRAFPSIAIPATPTLAHPGLAVRLLFLSGCTSRRCNLFPIYPYKIPKYVAFVYGGGSLIL